MTSHPPPLQVGAAIHPYSEAGNLPDADDSYYGRGKSHSAQDTFYVQQDSPRRLSGQSPASYGNVESMEYSVDARAVCNGIEHHAYNDQVYDVDATQRSPVSPNSWTAAPHYGYPAQTEASWIHEPSLRALPKGDGQITQGTEYYAESLYSQGGTLGRNNTAAFSPVSDAGPSAVHSYLHAQDIRAYHEYQTPLSHHYEGQYALSVPPTSSEYVSASTLGIPHQYHPPSETLGHQQQSTGSGHGRELDSEYNKDMQPGSPQGHAGSSHRAFASSTSQGYFQEPTVLSASGSVQHAVAQGGRAPSPMAHLPYPEDVLEHTEYEKWRSLQSHGWNTSQLPLSTEYGSCPTPPLLAQDTSSQAEYVDVNGHSLPIQPERAFSPPLPHGMPGHQPSPPLSVSVQKPQRAAVPTPPRSPPAVDDAPKKPLTLACLFCRKRKIACGSPPPGQKDRTCNQCARRNQTCVYPVVSRRGMRPRAGLEGDSNSVFQIQVPVTVVTQ